MKKVTNRSISYCIEKILSFYASRSRRLSYSQIAQYLMSDYGLEVSPRAVRNYTLALSDSFVGIIVSSAGCYYDEDEVLIDSFVDPAGFGRY